MDKQEKFAYLPTAAHSIDSSEVSALEEETPVPGKFPCPCCGYKTFPVPKEEAVAFICPVCFWENDVFDPGEYQPSDENRGMTLIQGREAFRQLGAVRADLVRYTRRPLPEEIP